MATTTNYAWETPDDTDLVKDGAAAIRTLGSSIDTTTKALNPSTTLGDIEYRSSTANTNTRLGIGTTGQVLAVSGGVPAWTNPSAGALNLIARTSFSGVASQAFDSVFTSTYKSYLVVIEKLAAATGTDALHLQLRVSGVTTTTSYYGTSINATTAGTAVTNTASNNVAQAILCSSTGSNEIRNGGYFYISNVGNASERSTGNGHYFDGANLRGAVFGFSNGSSAIYDGFLLKSASSNITGTVAIYGLVAA
jgi:hypothetical protein